MRHRILQSLAVAAAMFCSTGTLLAGNLPPEFVGVYRPAVDRLRQAYSQVSVEGTIVVQLPAEDKASEQTFTMRADGDKRRLDVTTDAQQGMGLKVGATEMSMATPWGSLTTVTGPQSQWFDNAKQQKYGNVVASIDRRSLLTYPYSLDSSGTILEMLQRSSVEVSGVKWIRQQGEPLVQVTYRENARHAGHAGDWNSVLVLSPADGWALRSFSRTLNEGGARITQRGALQYERGPSGIPLVRAINVETVDGNRVTRRETVSVGDIQFGAPGREYFDSWTF